MNIPFSQLREIKHSLPTGSITRIASQLDVSEQTVRNYFGANKFDDGEIVEKHIQPGPKGGIVNLSDTRILDAALGIIQEQRTS